MRNLTKLAAAAALSVAIAGSAFAATPAAQPAKKTATAKAPAMKAHAKKVEKKAKYALFPSRIKRPVRTLRGLAFCHRLPCAGFLIALAKNSEEPSLRLAGNIYTTIFRSLPEL